MNGFCLVAKLYLSVIYCLQSPTLQRPTSIYLLRFKCHSKVQLCCLHW